MGPGTLPATGSIQSESVSNDDRPPATAPPAGNGPGAAPLSPVQRRTLDTLRRSGDPLVFDPELADGLRGEMLSALDGFSERLDDGVEIFVTKHKIATALDCEEFHLEPDDFEWTPARAAGQVAHRAIQLMLWWRGEPTPNDLVDEAIARLVDEERGIGAWLGGLSAGDESDLRGQSVERVTKFVESFPPLDRRAHPVTEATARWPLDGPIQLRARVDLMIGRPVGDESRKLIVDLKTGHPTPRHRQDLGFYALLETLARGVPPRRLATFYLDASAAHAEDVGESLLRSAARRTLDGINAIIELELEGRPPVRRPGVTCRWCPLIAGCAPGQAHLDEQRNR